MSFKANNGSATLSEILTSHDCDHENCGEAVWSGMRALTSAGLVTFIIRVLGPYGSDTQNRVEKCRYKNITILIRVRSEEFIPSVNPKIQMLRKINHVSNCQLLALGNVGQKLQRADRCRIGGRGTSCFLNGAVSGEG
jgi:hypothetical protein